ncbi:MAG: mechanosensitive ion channel family protein [Acidobacteria bacterium]|nr:mechanosensitive ion channel family protein [Acidobacteriota bacterium]
MAWLDTPFWGNTVGDYLIAAALLAAVLAVVAVFREVARPRLAVEGVDARNVSHLLRDVVARTRLSLVLLVALFFVARSLVLPGIAWSFIRGAAIVAALLQAGLWVSAGVDNSIRRYRERNIDSDAASVTTITAVAFMGKFALWLVLLLVALDNFGVEITALVAGLGIGGIAVALALQNVLGDLFASLSIVVDKPFVIGDFIVIGEFAGSVEKIGLKTTRLRSIGGEQIIMSNADMLNSRIRNYKRMAERRVVYTFGLAHETSADKLEQVPKILREIIEGLEKARFDRAHLKGYGDASFLFEAVFWVTLPDFNIYMDVQQELSLKLVRKLSAEGIEFARPVRRLFSEDSEHDASRTFDRR